MAIKTYTGLMGSGKSYEVVTSVILPAIKKGRRVVTNIAGLNLDEFARISDIEKDQIQIVNVSHEAVEKPEFWLTDGTGITSTIQPGDLVCLDEIWRFFDGFKKPIDPCMNFVRMHRHFAHPETGVTCDLVLITQDVMDIGPSVRRVVEETYRMSKLTAVGRPDRYRVDVFSGGQKKDKLRSIQRKYNPDLFSLYKSHSQQRDDSTEATETNVDDRGNILKGGFFKFVIPAAIVMMLASGYYVFTFFSSQTTPQETAETPSQPATQAKQSAPTVEKKQRIAGYTHTSTGLVVYAYDGQEVQPLFNAPATKLTTITIEALNHEGQIISNSTYVEPARAVQPERPAAPAANSQLPVR